MSLKKLYLSVDIERPIENILDDIQEHIEDNKKGPEWRLIQTALKIRLLPTSNDNNYVLKITAGPSGSLTLPSKVIFEGSLQEIDSERTDIHGNIIIRKDLYKFVAIWLTVATLLVLLLIYTDSPRLKEFGAILTFVVIGNTLIEWFFKETFSSRHLVKLNIQLQKLFGEEFTTDGE